METISVCEVLRLFSNEPPINTDEERQLSESIFQFCHSLCREGTPWSPTISALRQFVRMIHEGALKTLENIMETVAIRTELTYYVMTQSSRLDYGSTLCPSGALCGSLPCQVSLRFDSLLNR
jgi:hypothetical protein